MLAIIGSHSDVHKDPIFKSDAEIWVFLEKEATLPRYDLVFQMHQPVDWGGGWSQRWLRANTKVPVYMREVYADVPMSVRYPFEDVFAMLKNVRHRKRPLRYFTSSIAWAIALAVVSSSLQIFATQ